jgi:hypothetical protein
MSGAGGGHQPAGTRSGLVSPGWLAALGIGSSILIMIVASATRYSATVPPVPRPDTMAVGLLAVYPASRLDWAVIGQFTAATVAIMPGSVLRLDPHWLATLAYLSSFRLMPLALFAATAALVWLCLSRAWNLAARPAVSHPDVPALQRAAAPDRLLRWPALRAAYLIRVGGRDSGTVLPVRIAH